MKVLTVNFTSPDAPKLFTDSLKNTGFAVVSHHPISAELVDGVYKEWERFFASDEKFQYLFDREKQDGYFPFLSENPKNNEAKDLKEFYHLYPWGRLPASMSIHTRQMYDEMNQLAQTLLQWIEDHTPAEIRSHFSMPLSQMIEKSPNTLLRIINYPALKGDEDPKAIRAGDHEDINLITLLPAATETGLQVKDTQGQWHDVSCDYGTIVVNSADMLQMCSEGYYRSTTHRVVNPKGEAARKARMSMPLFLHPNSDVRLSSKHTAKSYLIERLTEIGLY